MSAQKKACAGIASGETFVPSIVFSDLDGTFLARDKSIPAINREALKLLAKRHIPFVPCTGRPLSGITPDVAALPGVRYAVLANGVSIWDFGPDDSWLSEDVPSTSACESKASDQAIHALLDGGSIAYGIRCPGRFIYRQPMDATVFLRVYEKLRDLPITIDLFACGKAFCERARLPLLESFGLEEPLVRQILRSRIVVDEPLSELASSLKEVDRLSVYYYRLRDRDAVLSVLATEPSIAWTSSELTNIEAANRRASKGAALRWLCHSLGIDSKRAVAFGDGKNDVSMLTAAGLGVAVANAQPGVAEHADVVLARESDAGGVGEFLLELLRQDL